MRHKSSTVLLLTILLIYLKVQPTKQGFLYGQPCSPRNTLILRIPDPKMPTEYVQCVEMNQMGRRSPAKFLDLLKDGTELYADNMRLKRIPRLVLKSMPNLKLLDVSYNQIKKIHQRAFAKHNKLEKLLLADNRIVLPKNAPFLSSISLTTLQLSNNKLSRVYENTFIEMPNLVVLYLDNNGLRKIQPGVFKSLYHLKYLHLGKNVLKFMPSHQILPQNLKRLIVKDNPLSTNKTDVIK